MSARLRFVAPALVLLAACSSAAPRVSIIPGDRLASCPSAPHCVNSSDADERHHVDPFVIRPGAEDAWARIAKAVAESERTTIVAQGDRYLHATVLSPWHLYTDDLELLYLPEQGRVEVRSSSRVGYYDFHVNRDRVEALRRRLIEAGVLVPPGYP